MQDLEFYPTEDLIKELMKRSDSFLLLVEIPKVDVPDESEYEYTYKGDLDWIYKRIIREIIPKLEDEIEAEGEDKDDD